jgi:hypothetical protein
MSTDHLVQQFAVLAMRQDEALLGNDNAEVARLFSELMSIADELKTRPGDQRIALTSLYGHSNSQVRLKAAKSTLAVAPQAARQQLEEIKASQWSPQSMEAGMSIWNLDRGVFKPT